MVFKVFHNTNFLLPFRIFLEYILQINHFNISHFIYSPKTHLLNKLLALFKPKVPAPLVVPLDKDDFRPIDNVSALGTVIDSGVVVELLKDAGVFEEAVVVVIRSVSESNCKRGWRNTKLFGFTEPKFVPNVELPNAALLSFLLLIPAKSPKR